MKKGFRGTGTVERVNFPNKGIAVTDDGDRVIVDVYKRQMFSLVHLPSAHIWQQESAMTGSFVSTL